MIPNIFVFNVLNTWNSGILQVLILLLLCAPSSLLKYLDQRLPYLKNLCFRAGSEENLAEMDILFKKFRKSLI